VGKAVLLVALFALVVYGVLRLLERRHTVRPGRPEPPLGRPVAPDDDPDFLRDLERKRRRDQRQRDEPESS
jgi:hypothetical protein